LYVVTDWDGDEVEVDFRDSVQYEGRTLSVVEIVSSHSKLKDMQTGDWIGVIERYDNMSFSDFDKYASIPVSIAVAQKLPNGMEIVEFMQPGSLKRSGPSRL